MDGGRVGVDISSYQNDMTSFNGRDDILTMLIHLGYLGYDMENKQVFIPNKEIFDEFNTSTKSSEWLGTFTSFKKSQELLKETWAMKEDEVALLIELKYDKSLETAIDQIRNRNYPQKLEHYKENMLIISINYEKDTSSKEVSYKHHSCSIEKA